MGKSKSRHDLKSWLNHTCWFDLTTRRFDLEAYDLIGIWFKFIWYDLGFEQTKSVINMGRSESNVVFYTIFAQSHVYWQDKQYSDSLRRTKVIHVLYDFQSGFRKIWLSNAFVKREIFRMSEL